MPGGGDGGQVELRLYRDSLSTPWGFRLHGGKDLNCPFTVQKVQACSPAEGELFGGDVILEIQGTDASKLTHAQAQELITKAGGSILLRLARGGGRVYAPPSPIVTATYSRLPPKRLVPTPINQDFGTDYNRPKYLNSGPLPPANYNTPSSLMLSRVNDSLSSSLRSSISSTHSLPGYYNDYSSSSHISPPGENRSTTWGYLPVKTQTPVANSSATWQRGATNTPPQFTRAVTDEPPAWLGSLRPSSTPLASDSHTSSAPLPHVPKVQGVHYGVDGRPTYRPRAAEGGSDTARAAHLQYNTPIGLYSRENIEEVMAGQLDGKPGERTIGITTDTEVQKMLREEESAGRRGRRRVQPDPQAYQSPSVRALEAQLGVQQTSGGGEIGHSDF